MCGGYADWGSDANPNRYAHGHTNADSDRHADSYADRSDSDTNRHADSRPSHGHTHGHADCDTHGHADRDSPGSRDHL